MMRLSVAILAIGVLAGASAEAKPKIGVTCSGALLNKPGAAACTQKGKEDAAKGLTNIHFVACLADGNTFCCVKSSSEGYECSNILRISRSGSAPPGGGAILQP
jgi:hypothetical protein